MNLFMTLLDIGSTFRGLGSAVMQPLYWAVSGIVVGFHWLWSKVLDPDSGLTWALAIICLTIAIRALMIPLFVKQINSARNMQLLQPKIQELNKKYAADRQKLGEETMKLYQAEGVNPMASCLPLLIQMPIFLALFRVLQGAAEGIARGYWFKRDLDLMTSLQHAKIFGAELAGKVFPFTNGFGPNQILGILLVVLMVVTLFITQLQLMRKNMPPESLTGPMAQQQKMMLYLFPIVYAFSSALIPIGVLIYWVTTNIWTMGQQGLLIRNNPAPNTPAYIDWEERMRAKGLDPAEVMKERQAKRSNVRRAASVKVDATSDGDGARPTVARQQVTRQTVRTDEKQRVVRQQPRSQTRATRKK